MELKILIEYSAPSLPILPLEMYEEIKKHLPPPRPKKCIYNNRNRKTLYTEQRHNYNGGVSVFQCCICKYMTNKHTNNFTSFSFKLRKCCKDDIRKHLISCHLNECYKCYPCNRYFAKRKHLKIHNCKLDIQITDKPLNVYKYYS